MGVKEMSRWMPCPDTDPDAGDKAWDREKERADRLERLEREEMKTRLLENNNQMLNEIVENYRKGWLQ